MLKGEGDKHSEGEISNTDFLEQCAPFSTVTSVSRGSTFALRRSTLVF